jgi:ABC-type multidrug transport system ATPase subunit
MTLVLKKFETGYPGVDWKITAPANLELTPGIHALIAPNGFGKSTFFSTLSGLVAPSQYDVTFEGKFLEPKLGLLSISEYLSFPKFVTPREWIIANLESERADLQTVLDPWITKFRYGSIFNRYFGTLSQGERRKATWLLAEASDKKLVLLDEPLDGLDYPAILAARDILKTWKARGRTILIIAHQVSEIVDMLDGILSLPGRRLHYHRLADGERNREFIEKHFLKHYPELF